MKRSSLAWVLIIGAVLCGLFVVSLMAMMLVMSGGERSFGGGDRIAVIPVEGVIDDAMAKNVNRYLKLYADDSRIKAIMLRVDSPGGGVSPSQEIYREIKRIKDSNKKKTIVISMGSVAASGGYYIACPADMIFANPGTVTGSIGVIAEWVNYKDLADWARIKPVVFKSGEFKDTGSPTRELTERERVYFQAMIDELYGQFVAAVTEGRKGRGQKGSEIDPVRVKELADGRVYTGQSAQNYGLIDKLGNYGDALAETAKMVGIKGEPNVVTPPKERQGFSILDLVFGIAGLRDLTPASLPASLSDLDTSVKFKYQWK